jgi:hypothetical protein
MLLTGEGEQLSVGLCGEQRRWLPAGAFACIRELVK